MSILRGLSYLPSSAIMTSNQQNIMSVWHWRFILTSIRLLATSYLQYSQIYEFNYETDSLYYRYGYAAQGFL